MPRPRRWTDDQLTHAVAASATLSEVCRRIGIRPGRYDLLRHHIARIGADASHFTGRASTRRRTSRDRQEAPHAIVIVVHV